MNVVDSHMEHDVTQKPMPTFWHHALDLWRVRLSAGALSLLLHLAPIILLLDRDIPAKTLPSDAGISVSIDNPAVGEAHLSSNGAEPVRPLKPMTEAPAVPASAPLPQTPAAVPAVAAPPLAAAKAAMSPEAPLPPGPSSETLVPIVPTIVPGRAPPATDIGPPPSAQEVVPPSTAETASVGRQEMAQAASSPSIKPAPLPDAAGAPAEPPLTAARADPVARAVPILAESAFAPPPLPAARPVLHGAGVAPTPAEPPTTAALEPAPMTGAPKDSLRERPILDAMSSPAPLPPPAAAPSDLDAGRLAPAPAEPPPVVMTSDPIAGPTIVTVARPAAAPVPRPTVAPDAAVKAVALPAREATSIADAPPATATSQTDVKIAMSDVPHAVADMMRFIQTYNGGPCFLASPVSVTADEVLVDVLSPSRAPTEAFDATFHATTGVEAHLSGQVVAPAQCAAVDFLRQARGGGDTRLSIEIDRSPLHAGDTLTGKFRGAGDRSITLLLVSETGMVETLTRNIGAPGGTAPFAVRLGRGEGQGLLPQLLLALASRDPLPAADIPPAATASDLRRLLAQTSRDGQVLSAAGKLFLLAQ